MYSMQPTAGWASGATEAMVRAQLTRVLSGIFTVSPRLSRFLRFVVERPSEGKADELKEYAIGVEVFERESDFDPRIDAIVRVQGGQTAVQVDGILQLRGLRRRLGDLHSQGRLRPCFQASGIHFRQARRSTACPSRRTLEAREQAYVPGIDIAAAYAGFQNRVETLAWQHKAFGGKVHPIVFLYVDPGYRWLHDDRRFRAVLDRLRLRLRAYSRTTRPESPSTKSGSPCFRSVGIPGTLTTAGMHPPSQFQA